MEDTSIMNMLYDSESFVVVHIQTDTRANDSAFDDSALSSQPTTPRLARHGFEIVDKRTGKEVYLDGSWAEMFQQQLNAWEHQAPSEEEVDRILDGYTGLAQQPVLLH
ncbi:MAG: hypothetical protein GAK30_03783 [Paracidovorax wautersii]|uniref:DUF3567 domain-containing protein n=1 Tax=Paracidovorax wautersii TaxID=1177982 RepID=A0A7V8FKE2_9BURK|nr:MAG: hypothetical protein GAK30_03783 [Paracidovorax wautersii]